MFLNLKLHTSDATEEYRPLHAAGIYERTLACTYYDRLDAIYMAKVAELRAQGKSKHSAETAAERYVTATYCEGHPRQIYAVAQARVQLVREGMIPTNASVIPKLWEYDPYTRLCPAYAAYVATRKAE